MPTSPYRTYDELTIEEKENLQLVNETMRKITSDEVLQAIERELLETHEDFATYLQQYIADHRGKSKIFAWYRQGKACGLFCPEDHSGRWFMRVDHLSGVGTIREGSIAVLESLARSKGLL